MRQRAVDLRAMERQARRAADFLRLLASEHRLLILCAVAEQERSVGEIATLLAIAQPNASQHLFKLRTDGLVASRRAGQTIYYRLASEHVRPIIAHLHAMFCED
jgi:DNA-binding transcriptional ArsR family regulator